MEKWEYISNFWATLNIFMPITTFGAVIRLFVSYHFAHYLSMITDSKKSLPFSEPNHPPSSVFTWYIYGPLDNQHTMEASIHLNKFIFQDDLQSLLSII